MFATNKRYYDVFGDVLYITHLFCISLNAVA